MDWISGCPEFLVIIARLSIWLSINSSGKIRKHPKIVFAFQSLYRDVFWQQGLWSEVRAPGLLGGALRLLGAALDLLGAPVSILGAT